MEEISDYDKQKLDDINQYLASNGLMFKENALADTFTYVPAPVALRPTLISKEVYDGIRANQLEFNSMVEYMLRLGRSCTLTLSFYYFEG